ncbi:MAG: hypothetical protein ABR574_07265 [Cryomorphaceae bacterium]|nr:hypothetical protein [Flavobacteriales bacterium]
MRSITFVFLFIGVFAFGQESENGDETTRKFGLSASIQSDQFGILMPFWVSEKSALVPSFQLNFAETVGLDLGFGLSFRQYLREGKMRPYLAPGFGVLVAIPDKSGSEREDLPNPVDFVFGFGVGGEYFFSDYFSAGVQIGLNGAVADSDSNRFGNPGGFNLNTASSVLVNVYF